MNFALVYIVQRFFYRILEFFRHWYVRSGRMYSNWVLNRLEDMDYHIAWRITFKNLFQPLYKDYSVIGYLLGFIFRSLRLVAGGLVYMAVFFVAIGCYIIWLLAPAYVFFHLIVGI